MDVPQTALNPARQRWGWGLLLLAALLVYASGLESLYLPSIGDEMVYTHIARLTAAAGHWLPLVSDLDHMRNTKPPLLFWQALVAGDWGAHWQLWRLRLPSVTYTFLVTLGVAQATGWLTRERATAWRAACIYLGFFCTLRFGRPYLTSAAESFWFGLPLLTLLWRARRSPPSAEVLPGWGLCTLWGISWGLGLAYKSFALVLPTAAGMGAVLLVLYGGDHWRRALPRLLPIALRVSWSGLVALSLFGLWFALDPDPQAVWREFVLGENAGKLASEGWRSAASGMLVQLLSPLENAGPLALPVLGLLLAARHGAPSSTLPSASASDPRSAPTVNTGRWSLALAAWLLVWVLVFCLPSQRSARYVIPAMPALAVLLALYWPRIAGGWFVALLLLCLPPCLLLARVGQVEWLLGIASLTEALVMLTVATAGLLALCAGLWRAPWRRACALAAVLALYALLNAVLAPLSGPAGHFADAALAPGSDVAVPSTFNAQYERYQFLLPGAERLRFAPYDPRADEAQLTALLAAHDAVVWPQDSGADAPACARGTPVSCTVLAWRWDVKTRQRPGEIRLDNLAYPQQWLLRREWLLVPTDGR